jgi:hypothetical protein
VRNNDLQPEGCRVLLGALAFHPTLTALDISSNMLSLFQDKSGYLALSYLLRYAHALCWLDISDNALPKQAFPVLRESLMANASLTCLNAKRCNIPTQSALLGSSSVTDHGEPTNNTATMGILHRLEV